MATLDLCPVILFFICRVCAAVVETNVFDFVHKNQDEYSLPSSLFRDTEPGVALFYQHEECNLTAFTDQGYILHTLIQDDHIENFTLQFVAFGKRFLVDLHLTKDLFASSYTRKILHKKEKHLRDSLDKKEHCYYQGKIRNNPASNAALSSCDGFSGYIFDGHETYHIDPLGGQLHRIFRNSDRKKFPIKCGTDGHDVHHKAQFTQRVRKKRSIRGPYDANKFTRYVELYLVNDYRTFDRYGKNATLVFERSQNIANIVNSLYRQLNIYIVLVGVEVWSTGDKINIISNADTTMENFLRYRKERINPYHPNDNAQLITGIFFDHGVVGKAIKGPICTHQFSGGVSMDYDGLVTLVATTMAHEMGHNFGMEHDNDTKCSCPEDKCIMAATSGHISPQHWSSCSQNALHEAFELGMDYCLRNPPTVIFDSPVCGNGFVEEGEECDCGLPEDCTNRCCNATSCVIHPQAVCATGRCCDLDTCQPKKPASLCREPKGECDLPEYCDGATEFCPPDVHVRDGISCGGGQAYCYKGVCNTHNAQCQLLWGNTGRVSDPICFIQLNTRGDHDGNCGYNWTTDRYHTCDRENVMCGLLHCVHLNEKLMFWRDNLALDMRANFLTRGNTQYVCRSTMLDVGLDMPDPGLVPDGAKCEEDKICIKQTCTPLMKLKIAQCPDCHSNGVCNSAGNCHCHVGYAPPLCDRPGYGGSIDSGPASNEYAKRGLLIGLLVLFLVILPLVALAFLAYINRQRLLKWWKLGPGVKFGVLKKSQSAPQPPQPRPSASFSEKRWSSAPPKPNTSLEISGPLIEDPPSYNDCIQHAAPSRPVLLPSAPTRPIFKPSANKPSVIPPKLNPPAARQSTAAAVPPAAVPAVTIAGRERKSFFGLRAAASPQPIVEKTPLSSTTETTRPSLLVPLSNVTGESTLKRQQKGKETKKGDDRPAQSPPASPSKGDRKVMHSQSMREPRARDQLATGEKIVKRESFRGAEISSPILVSTTNRDSQVFAEFELDESGVVARPIGKQHSVDGSNPSAEGARDGCRSPVRRSQSDRPLSPKRRGNVTDTAKKPAQQGQGFTPRPLPPEPVLETEPILETEPLYINGGLSDLEDLKAQISSAFDGINLNLPVASNTTPSAKPSASSKPATTVSSSLLNRATLNPVSSPSTSASSSSSLKPSQLSSTSRPSHGSTSAASKQPQSSSSSSSSKATPLERVLNNPIKKPFGNSTVGSTTAVSAVPSNKTTIITGPSKPSTVTSSANSGNKPSAVTATKSGSTVRGPFGTALNKTSSNTDTSKVSAGSGVSQASSSSTAVKAPSSGAANKSATPSAASKGPGTANTVIRGPSSTVSSTTSKPTSASKFSTPGVSNKGSTSTTSNKGPSTGAASKGPTAASSSVSRSASNSAGRANLQRSASGASRPAVAPKPGAAKSVRSYNF